MVCVFFLLARVALAQDAPNEVQGPRGHSRLTAAARAGAGLAGGELAPMAGVEGGLLVWDAGAGRVAPRARLSLSWEARLPVRNGEEARALLRVGPRGARAGLDLGAGLAWSRLRTAGLQRQPSLGLSLPLGLDLDPGPVRVELLAERLWFVEPGRAFGSVLGAEQTLSLGLLLPSQASWLGLRLGLHLGGAGRSGSLLFEWSA